MRRPISKKHKQFPHVWYSESNDQNQKIEIGKELREASFPAFSFHCGDKNVQSIKQDFVCFTVLET